MTTEACARIARPMATRWADGGTPAAGAVHVRLGSHCLSQERRQEHANGPRLGLPNREFGRRHAGGHGRRAVSHRCTGDGVRVAGDGHSEAWTHRPAETRSSPKP